MNLEEIEKAKAISLKNIHSIHAELAQAFREKDNKKINSLCCRLSIHERLYEQLKEKQKSLNKQQTSNV